MKLQFQNRLVGTIVLVALGVIFLPDLLDGKKAKVVEEFTEIPLRSAPLVQSKPLTPDDFEVLDVASVDIDNDDNQSQLDPDIVPLGTNAAKPVTKEPAAKKEIESANTQPKTVPSKPVISQPIVVPKPSVKAASSPIKSGYTLQLGGFNNAANVNALIAKLRLSGYTAYTLPAKPVEGTLTRVFVGPEVSKDKLEARQTAIAKLTGLTGRILTYDPMDK
ncbi:cell division protein DedD [Shewanella sp. OMA3-2]|uniref:cell division protein DedD n=1 Tax=Shewanella sp. OMA3-2 TaxID=2908650 RepID=UPI001F456F13|nr:cell division protein DedD [Shewanella sp. OMA3-2]UJF23270.1 cell division protein DedD [Shewanella sp. OMA3-2]